MSQGEEENAEYAQKLKEAGLYEEWKKSGKEVIDFLIGKIKEKGEENGE